MNEVPGAWEMGSDSDSASNWTCLKDIEGRHDRKIPTWRA